MTANFQVIFTSVVIAPSGNYYSDFQLSDWKYGRLLAQVKYAATASQTGIDIDIYPGTGTLDVQASGGIPSISRPTVPTPTFGIAPFWADNGMSVTMADPNPSTVSEQVKETMFYLDSPLMRYGGLARFKFTNQDTANSATVNFYADMS
jgi:hypothetical protein